MKKLKEAWNSLSSKIQWPGGQARTSSEKNLTPKAQGRQWSAKLTLTGPKIALCALAVAVIFLGLRYRYWAKISYTQTVRVSIAAVGAGAAAILPHSMRELKSTDEGSGSGKASGRAGRGSYADSVRHAEGARILSRPLFDNLTVTVRVELSRGVTAVRGESPGDAEARFIRLIPDGVVTAVDPGLEGATLIGQVQPMFAQRRLGFSFTELVTTHGARYSIQAVAIDPATRALGIAANYSSGLGSRALGVAISSALNTASQVASSRILQNTADSSEVSRELMRQSLDGAGEPASEMNQELTRDLRETKAVLSVDAGTALTLRLKATAGGTRGGGK